MNSKLTKILATIGPSSEPPEVLRTLFQSGLNACRLNLSHGDHEEHGSRITNIRAISAELNMPIAILMDLCGPKVRTDNQPYTIAKDEIWKLVPHVGAAQGTSGNAEKKEMGIQHGTLHKLVHPGAQILLDDGKFELIVTECLPDGILCRVVDGGLVKPRKAVNTPNIDNELSCLSEKDQKDLKFGMERGVDWVAVSFVRNGADMRQVRDFMTAHNWHAPLIAKIETPLAMNNLEDILENSDGLMVARGDLGIECPLEDIPLHQNRIINLAKKHGKLAIVATQMLESMIDNPRPTRAEVTDISHAVSEGTQVTMLSGETANGKHPVEAVRIMNRILYRTEQAQEVLPLRREGIPESHEVIWAAVKLQARMHAHAIVVHVSSLEEVASVSSLRSRAPVFAVCSNERLYKQANLYYGIRPILIPEFNFPKETIEYSVNFLKEKGLVSVGHKVVFIFEHHSAVRVLDIA